MRKVFLSLVLGFACFYAGTAIPPISESSAFSYLEVRGEVYFSFSVPDSQVLALLLETISIEGIKEDRVYAYANSSEFEAFLHFAIDYLVHIPPGLQAAEKQINMRSSVDISEVNSWDFYPTYEAYESMMEQYASTFPELCSLVNIETLESGRKLLFLKISGDNITEHARPRFMYTSTMHGDEPPGFNLMLRLIHHLLNGYGQDETVTYLMDRLEIWVCPNENPDGTYTHDNSTIFGGTRSNSSGIDLNRNYPAVVNGSAASVQPETQAMIGLVDSLPFVMSANIHTGIECVNFPFDQWISSVRKHADHNWWKFVSHEYADTARLYSPANYMNPFGSNFDRGVTHGGDWYVVTGSRQDFMNYYARQREFTLELSKVKSPDTDALQALWDYNHRSLINYMFQSLYGIHGVVRDGHKGENLIASIGLPDYDDDVSGVITALPGGNFHRPLLEGVYDLKIESEGYLTQHFHGVEASNYEVLFLDVDMSRLIFEPLSVAFEPAIPGGSSSQTIFMTNTGEADLNLTIGEITGDPVFSYGVTSKTTINIPAGGHESIELWFSPSNVGTYAAHLAVTLNLPHQPQVFLPLYGEALSEAALLYTVEKVLDFGAVPLNQSLTLDLPLRNTGNMELEISDVVITNDAFSVGIFPPVTLNAGDQMTIPVIFTPALAKTYTATLSFESNASNNGYEIALQGTGNDNTWVNETGNNLTEVRVFPNPIDITSYLEWSLTSAGPLIIQLFDHTGSYVFSIDYGSLEPGTHRFALDQLTKQLPVGIYFMQVLSKNSSKTIKMLKIIP